MTGGPHKIAQHGNVWAISPDAACIYGEAKPFGGFQVYPGVVEFRQAKAHRGKHTINSTWIHGAGRTVLMPPAVDYCEELVPIVFVPHGSLLQLRDSRPYLHVMRQTPIR